MPIQSMTGFGQARKEAKQVSLSVEIKTVNHRFLDLYFKLPNQYAAFEQKLTKLIKEKLSRGRVEIYVGRDETATATPEVRFNNAAFESYVKSVRKALKSVGVGPADAAYAQAISAGLQRREVLDLVSKQSNSSTEYSLVAQAVTAALNDMMKMRAAEGKELEKELLRLLNDFSRNITRIKSLVDVDVKDIQKRIRDRVAKLFPDITIDPDRLAAEAALLAEKADVTEEIARLDSHLVQFNELLKKDVSGRKMEFLLQEMGREVNTLGTKAQQSKISVLVVEVKALLEKLREQVANIE